ncbi:MAG: hypothetical protein ACK5LC_13030 [Coprobacillaceae bacterium]
MKNINYFKLKYSTFDSYFQCMISENYTHGQSTGRTLYEHTFDIDESDIGLLIVYSATFAILASYESKTLLNYQKDIKSMNKVMEKINVLDYVTAEEYEYLKEDVDEINFNLKEAIGLKKYLKIKK